MFTLIQKTKKSAHTKDVALKLNVNPASVTEMFSKLTEEGYTYYEKYNELGLAEYGVGLSCCRDEPFARGFNPNLKLVRTQTIMEGAEHCDFRYYLKAL